MRLFGIGKKADRPTALSDDSASQSDLRIPNVNSAPEPATGDEFDERYGGTDKLHWAAMDGDVAAMKHFTGRGYDLERRKDDGATPQPGLTM